MAIKRIILAAVLGSTVAGASGCSMCERWFGTPMAGSPAPSTGAPATPTTPAPLGATTSPRAPTDGAGPSRSALPTSAGSGAYGYPSN